MKKVFVCSPFKGNVEENTKLARRVRTSLWCAATFRWPRTSISRSS